MIKKMSLILITVIVLVSVFPANSLAADGEMTWYSYNQGLEKARSQGKPVFIDFWAEWCSPCVEMENNVYPDQEVIEKSTEFINIKVDVEDNSNLASKYNIQNIPTLMFLDPEGEVIKKEVGYRNSSELIGLMDEVLGSTSNSNPNGQTPTDKEAQEEDPFWKSLIFIEIIISILVAAGIIFFLSRTKGKEDNQV